MEQNQTHKSENFWTLLEKYKSQLGAILGLTVLVSIGYYGWDFYVSQKENQALDAYSAGEKLYVANLGAQEFTDGKNKEGQVTQVDSSPAENRFHEVIQKYPGTNAHYLAAFRLSEIYAKKNDFSKTESILEPISNKGSLKDMMVNLLSLQLTGIYEKNKKCDKAIPVLENISQKTPHISFKPEALMRLALCQEQVGKKEQAVDTYKKLSKEYPESVQAKQAQKFLKILDL